MDVKSTVVLTEFPDLNWLKRQIDQRFANREAWGGGILKEPGWPTVILNTISRQTTRENICGPLSFFYNVSGVSHIKADRHSVCVRPGHFFLTNPDQHYSLEIDPKTGPTETFNIHFGTHFAEAMIASLAHSPEFLLDHPFINRKGHFIFTIGFIPVMKISRGSSIQCGPKMIRVKSFSSNKLCNS